jgi:flagellar protein FliS
MTQYQGIGAYTKTQVTTTTNQKDLIVMAYDGILRFLNQARGHMAAQEIEATHVNLTKARAIIEELAGTLNMEAGGEIARNLWNLYVFFMKEIMEANVSKDASHIDAIQPAIQDLREAWATMEIPKDDAKIQALNHRVPTAETTHRVSVAG